MKRMIRNLATSLTFITLVAMAARMTFAWDQAHKISPDVLAVVPFQQETGNIAYSLIQGRGFGGVFRADTGPTAWLAPIYPLMIAAIFKIFGVFTTRAFVAAVFMNIIFSSAACLPVFFAAKRIAGVGTASFAAWLWALFPNAIMVPFEWIWDTALSALLASTILLATLKLSDSDRTRAWSAYGLLWGFALMTNPGLGALLPFLLGWLAYRGMLPSLGRLAQRDSSGSESHRRWKLVAFAAGIAILCCVPWTIRNYAAFHRFIPLRSNLPFELWLGNNDIFDEHAKNGRKFITRTEETRRYAQLGETAYMQEKWRLATTFMASHPVFEVYLAERKCVAFWTGLESPFKTFRETDSNLVRTVLLSSFLTAIGALAGILILWRSRNGMTFPIAVFPIIFPCLYYVTHADLRYRHPIDPVLCLLTATTLASTWNAHKPGYTADMPIDKEGLETRPLIQSRLCQESRMSPNRQTKQLAYLPPYMSLFLS